MEGILCQRQNDAFPILVVGLSSVYQPHNKKNAKCAANARQRQNDAFPIFGRSAIRRLKAP